MKKDFSSILNEVEKPIKNSCFINYNSFLIFSNWQYDLTVYYIRLYHQVNHGTIEYNIV